MFAVMTAGLFPILHLGRPWKFFWLIPYPNWRLIWPQFKSPLGVGRVRDPHLPHDLGDVPVHRAASRYRGAARSRKRIRFEARSSGACRWAGAIQIESGGTSRAPTCSSPRWPRRSCCRCTRWCPSTSRWRIVPGWHATIFPPYFVAGAIFSGMGMVFTIIIPLRKFMNLRHYVTLNDLDAGAKLCLFTSIVVGMRVSHRVPHRLALRQSGGAGVLVEPRLRPVVVGRVDHDALQHGPAAVALLAEAPAQPDRGCSFCRCSSISECGSSDS